MSRYRVVVAAGGTGGHISPAESLVSSLSDEADCFWVGRQNSMESAAAQRCQATLLVVEARGVRGKSLWGRAKGVIMLLCAIIQLVREFLRLKPDVVVGFGGYVSAAAGIAAFICRIPLVIHEQNAIAGSANRLLSRLASAVAQSFPNTIADAHHTGNPVRADFKPHVNNSQSKATQVLVMGGSQGAKALNESVPVAAAKVPALSIRHQCGRGHRAATQSAYEQAGVDAGVFEFDINMAAQFAWADVLIARAGASTVAEVAATQLPTCFVPLPTAIDDHQRANATALVSVGGAKLIEQGEDFEDRLSDALMQLSDNTDARDRMSKSLLDSKVADTEGRLAKLVMEVIHS